MNTTLKAMDASQQQSMMMPSFFLPMRSRTSPGKKTPPKAYSTSVWCRIQLGRRLVFDDGNIRRVCADRGCNSRKCRDVSVGGNCGQHRVRESGSMPGFRAFGACVTVDFP